MGMKEELIKGVGGPFPGLFFLGHQMSKMPKLGIRVYSFQIS